MKSFKVLILISLAFFIYSCDGSKEGGIPERQTDTGVPYEIVSEGDGRQIEQGDIVGLRMKYTIMRNDSTYSTNYNQDDPAFLPVREPQRYGDPSEWLALMNDGDSAHFYLNVDSLGTEGELPPFLQQGDIIKSSIKVESVMTQEEFQTYQNEKQSQEAMGQMAELRSKVDALGITEYKETPEGVIYSIAEAGNGPRPENGDIVKVHYVGRLFEGDTFDNSYERGEPFTFTIGKSQMITGWHKGLPYFSEGSKATLYIPPSLAFGEQGGGPIPPNAYLIFDIEVLEVTDAVAEAKKADERLKQYLQENNIEATKAPEGYYYTIDEAGSGPKPQPGQTVKVHYTGRLIDGTKFDSSLDRGEPFELTVGQGQVIQGWDLGLQQFPVGSKGRLFIPPSLGYGSQAQRTIPANSVLIFEIELISAG
jgi:peptidylprolyl isomerase